MNRRIVAGLVAASVGAVAAPARAQAQEAVIAGRVTSDRGGEGIAGASVAIPELGVGVLTNAVGNYTLSVPAARVRGQSVTLVARYIGYKALRRQVTLSAGRQTQAITLETDANRLTEVVVTGVSAATEQIRTPVTVQRVDTTQMPVVGTSAISQLQGKVPGANIVAASGRPGAAPSVLLRGPTSINAQGRSQEPLYIVDGILLNGTIADINPNDIESIEIVKGAAAANLYGARAGAGVINITTKSGRAAGDGVKFGVRTEGGTGTVPRDFSLAQRSIIAADETGRYYCANVTTNGSSCAQVIDLLAETKRVNEVSSAFALPPALFLNDGGVGSAPSFGQLTGEFQTTQFPRTRNVLSQFTTANTFANTNVDVRGRVGGTGVYGSVSNLTNQGSIRYLGGYTRNGARANIDQRFTDKLSLTLQSFYSATRSQGDNQDFGGGNAFFRVTRAPAFVDLTQRDANGRLYVRTNVLSQGEQNGNPLYDIENNRQTSKGTRFLGGSTVKYDPFEWVTVEGNFSYDRGTSDDNLLNDLGFRSTTASPSVNNGFLAYGQSDQESLNSSGTVTLRRQLFADFRATLTGRYQYDQQSSTFSGLQGSVLVVPGLNTGDAITDQNSKQVTTSRTLVRGQAYIGSLQLDFKDRYLIQANLRRDGSSLFGRNNRWANFPGISGSWVVSREPWWFGGTPLSLLKLRTAYGQTGQRPSFAAQYATFTIGNGGSLVPSTLGNPNLRPEVRSEIEYGAELEFFKRYGLSVTYATDNIRDQILPVPLPVGSGFSQQYQNAGTLQNKSLEMSLDVPIVTKRDFSWSGRVIYDRLRSKITELNRAPYFTFGGSIVSTPGQAAAIAQATETIFRIAPGEEMGSLYGRDFVRSCGQLPKSFASQCSSDRSNTAAAFRPNSDGYITWVGAGNLTTEGVTKNLWRAQLFGANAPWGDRTVYTNQSGAYRLSWGMPILLRDSTGNPASVKLGSTLPRYRYGVTQNVRYKSLTLYGLLDASIGARIWNQGYHWSLGDFMTGTIDANGKSVEDAKPIGYWFRAGPGTGGNATGVGGFYDVLGPNRYTMEDGTYWKLRELSATYRFGRLPTVGGNWSLGLVGRNLLTFTRNYRGFDPEVGLSGGAFNNPALNGIDRFTYPNLRTATVQLSTAF